MKLIMQMLRRLIAGFALMALVHGCATMDNYLPASPQQISAQKESRLGAAVERRLLQMLGGLYQDEELSALMIRMGEKVGINVSIADKSSAAVYPLPGERVVLTRGLLMEIEKLDQLETLLKRAASMSNSAMKNIDSRAMTKEVQEFFADKGSSYDPGSAAIRIAGHFADLPCEGACLHEAMPTLNGKTTLLPESILALQVARPGYELLAKAGALEKSGDRSQAISTYLQAATTAPDHAHILASLGMAYLRAGDLQSARLHLERADRLQPGYYKTLMGLGYVYLQTNKVNKAKDALAESVRLLPVTENMFLLAEAMEQSGERARAIALYEAVIANDRYSKLGRTAKLRLRGAGAQ